MASAKTSSRIYQKCPDCSSSRATRRLPTRTRQSNVADICRELGVRFALEGSIRKAGNRVRITAQLIDGATGGHVWADRYDRELADIFAVQDEVTREIVSALAPKLTEAKQKHFGRDQPTDNLEAYDCLLRGRELWWRLTKQANADARSMFERAVELDPNFATAFAWLGAAHLIDSAQPMERISGTVRTPTFRIGAITRSRWMTKTRSLMFMLGMAYLRARQHDLAIAEGEKAIALDPNFAHARLDLAWFLHFAGRSSRSA